MSGSVWSSMARAMRAAGALPGWVPDRWTWPWALPLSLLLLLGPCLLLGRWAIAPLRRLLRALEGVVASYHDGDFSFSLAESSSRELRTLVRLHNELGQILRSQRHGLVQRELMLDTVVQNTPVALVLTDANDRIAYANIAARHLFHEGRSLHGLAFEPLLGRLPAALLDTVRRDEDALLPIRIGDEDEVFHISLRTFRLQGRVHRLHLFRRMTRELSRQEVDSWKRLIRVISHELNNSLAPISSLAHSGGELVRRGEMARLPGVLASIGERARHLHGFIEAYASFARLPAPRLQTVEWPGFLESLALQCPFQLIAPVPRRPGRFDPVQLEQVLINLLKNAVEADPEHERVELRVQQTPQQLRIEVLDRGPGMSDAVLAQALLPFYSTKRSGTGLGLALVREIVEAHGGRISLANREGGGLRVQLNLPQTEPGTETGHENI
ncbi:sensor histidine kinase [Frateuria aurantia]